MRPKKSRQISLSKIKQFTEELLQARRENILHRRNTPFKYTTISMHPDYQEVSCESREASVTIVTFYSTSKQVSRELGVITGAWAAIIKPMQESGHVRPWQGTEICDFGQVSPLDLLSFLQWTFLSLQIFCVPSDTKLLLTKNYSEITILINYAFHA